VRSRARWLYRLHSLIAVAGVVTALAALAVALSATSLSLPPAGTLLAACRSWLVPFTHPARLLVLSLEVLGLAVIYRAARSGWRTYRASRLFVRRLRPAGELAGAPRVLLVNNPEPQAFCAGLLRPRVYLSTGALERLDDAELRAVVAHEAEHALRRDPLRLFAAHVLSDALFFLPVMRRLHRRYASLAELAADEAAISSSGNAQPLASALLTFGELQATGVVGASTERIDHLLGERPRWELPTSLLLGTTISLAALAAVLITIAHATEGSQLSAATLLMQSCNPAILLIAGLLSLRALRLARPTTRRSGGPAANRT
jgi:Zn-dependent protease with chaperone function